MWCAEFSARNMLCNSKLTKLVKDAQIEPRQETRSNHTSGTVTDSSLRFLFHFALASVGRTVSASSLDNKYSTRSGLFAAPLLARNGSGDTVSAETMGEDASGCGGEGVGTGGVALSKKRRGSTSMLKASRDDAHSGRRVGKSLGAPW